MLDLFSQGGPVFMGILTIILLSLFGVFIKQIINHKDEKQLTQSLQWMKSIATLGLVVGILGQLIGLFTAFSIMETTQGISTNILAGGFKVSLITTLYGLFIYTFYVLLSMILKKIQS